MERKKLFILLLNCSFLFVSLLVASFQCYNISSDHFNEIVQNFRHFRTKSKEIDHYTIPLSIANIPNTTEKSSNNTYYYDFFDFQNRGFVNCTHFESELTCNDVKYLRNKWNNTLNSNKFLFLNVKSTSIEMKMKSVASAFILAMATNRKLIFTKKISEIPIEMNITVKKPFKDSLRFRSIEKCTYKRVFETNAKSIVLEGYFDPIDVILDPFVYKSISFPLTTHFMQIMSRFVFVPKNISFPGDQLQVGISLEFNPEWKVLMQQLEEVTEGYSNYSLHIYNPNRLHIPKKVILMESAKNGIALTINEYSQLKDCFFLLMSCDNFFGSLGYPDSFILTTIRGRGGHYFNPKDSKIIETPSSQSGYLFSVNYHSNTANLMCPNGADAFQNFISFLSF